MLRTRSLRELADMMPAPLVVVLIPILIWALVERQLRRIRCSFCAGPYAYWSRAHGRACRSCKRDIDRKIRQLTRRRTLYERVVHGSAGGMFR